MVLSVPFQRWVKQIAVVIKLQEIKGLYLNLNQENITHLQN